MDTTFEIATLKELIRETMREVLQEERILLFKMLMPIISDEEQTSIENQFGLRSRINLDCPTKTTMNGLT